MKLLIICFQFFNKLNTDFQNYKRFCLDKKKLCCFYSKVSVILFMAKMFYILLIVMIASCTHKDEDEKYMELTGDWISRFDGSKLMITKEETFAVQIKDGSSVTIEGSLWHNKGNVYFLNSPDAVRCKGDTGVYQFVLVGGNLEFSVVKDKCKSRIEHLTNIWVRKSTLQ